MILMLQSMMGKERFFQGIAVSESDFNVQSMMGKERFFQGIAVSESDFNATVYDGKGEILSRNSGK